MLDDVISTHAADIAQADGRRAALIVSRVARLVSVPALLLMLGGLLAYGIGSGQFLARSGAILPGPAVGSLAQLTGGGRLFTGGTAMSLGLLGLALGPAITVSWILADNLRRRRWKEAVVAAAIVTIMALSAILGKK